MKKALLIVVLAVAAIGCGKKEKGATVNTRQGDGGAAAAAIASERGNQAWGAVGADQAYYNEFQEVMRVWVESEMSPEYIGRVSPDLDDAENSGTGVRFWGRIQLSGGSQLTSNNMPLTQVDANGTVFGLGIWDSYVDQKDESGNTILPFVMFFNSAGMLRSGSVQGNQFQLVFEDSYRRVTLDGQFDAEFADGTITIDNKRLYDGSNLSSGQSSAGAYFIVPTCGFFTCAN